MLSKNNLLLLRMVVFLILGCEKNITDKNYGEMELSSEYCDKILSEYKWY